MIPTMTLKIAVGAQEATTGARKGCRGSRTTVTEDRAGVARRHGVSCVHFAVAAETETRRVGAAVDHCRCVIAEVARFLVWIWWWKYARWFFFFNHFSFFVIFFFLSFVDRFCSLFEVRPFEREEDERRGSLGVGSGTRGPRDKWTSNLESAVIMIG
jgi:hypothetical protein